MFNFRNEFIRTSNPQRKIMKLLCLTFIGSLIAQTLAFAGGYPEVCGNLSSRHQANGGMKICGQIVESNEDYDLIQGVTGRIDSTDVLTRHAVANKICRAWNYRGSKFMGTLTERKYAETRIISGPHRGEVVASPFLLDESHKNLSIFSLKCLK